MLGTVLGHVSFLGVATSGDFCSGPLVGSNVCGLTVPKQFLEIQFNVFIGQREAGLGEWWSKFGGRGLGEKGGGDSLLATQQDLFHRPEQVLRSGVMVPYCSHSVNV